METITTLRSVESLLAAYDEVADVANNNRVTDGAPGVVVVMINSIGKDLLTIKNNLKNNEL